MLSADAADISEIRRERRLPFEGGLFPPSSPGALAFRWPVDEVEVTEEGVADLQIATSIPKTLAGEKNYLPGRILAPRSTSLRGSILATV